MNRNKDYYEVLGVGEDTPADKIKEAYRKLAFQYHPDKNPGDAGAVERMKEINEAYAVLSEPEKRQSYDRVRRQYGSSSAHDQFRQAYSEEDIFRGSDINQIFEEMARSFGVRGFEEIFRGVYGQGYRTFEFHRPGVFGKFIIFGAPGRARPRPQASVPGPQGGILGKVAGYLLKKALGLGDPVRAGKDVHNVIALDPDQASRGGKMMYKDPRRGKEIVITMPPGLREGQKVRLKGMGAPARNGGPPGDLYLNVVLKKPMLARFRKFLKI